MQGCRDFLALAFRDSRLFAQDVKGFSSQPWGIECLRFSIQSQRLKPEAQFRVRGELGDPKPYLGPAM